MQVVVSERLYLSARPDALTMRLEQEFSHTNPKYGRQRAMGFKGWREPPVIATFRHEANGVMSLPRGGWNRLHAACAALGVPIEQADHRAMGELVVPPVQARVKQLEHQERAVRAMLAAEQGLVLAPTRSGKTIIGILAALRARQRAIFIVMDKALMEQWEKAARFVLGDDYEVGCIGGGRKTRVLSITVAMQQTLARWDDRDLERLFAGFGMLVADEVQAGAAPTVQRVIDLAGCRYRFGVTADERRTDRKEFLTRDVFGEPVIRIDRAELEAAGLIVEPEVVLHPTEFRADWYGEQKLAGEVPDHTRLEDEAAADDARNMIGARLAAHAHQEGQTVLVLVNRREHARVVQAMLRAVGVEAPLLIGGEPDFEQTRLVLGKREIRCAVGTVKAAGTGLDMPAVDRVVLLGIVRSRLLMNQVKGRACTAAEGKTGARVDVLVDPHVFGDKAVKEHRPQHSRCGVAVPGGMIQPIKDWCTARAREARARKQKEAENGGTTTGSSGTTGGAGPTPTRAGIGPAPAKRRRSGR